MECANVNIKYTDIFHSPSKQVSLSVIDLTLNTSECAAFSWNSFRKYDKKSLRKFKSSQRMTAKFALQSIVACAPFHRSDQNCNRKNQPHRYYHRRRRWWLSFLLHENETQNTEHAMNFDSFISNLNSVSFSGQQRRENE